MTISEEFASFAFQLERKIIPDSSFAAVKLHFLDSLSVMIAAESKNIARQGLLLSKLNGGAPQSTAIGLSFKVPAANAALSNGMLAHALDFDDSHSNSVTHPSAVIVPAALAVAEMCNASESDCLVAAIAGYEINARIGMVAGSQFMLRGFHTTALAGAFAAAVTAGKLLGLSEKQLVSALGLVGSQASGLIEFLSDGTDSKQLHAGWAAHAGVIAAYFTQQGLTGPASIFEGRYGLYKAHLGADEVSLEGITATLGQEWTTEDIAYKAYPACHLTHTAVEALLYIIREHNINIQNIARIHCFVPDYYVTRVLEPTEFKMSPRSPYEAKFSLPYCLAAAAYQGTLTLDSFDQKALADEKTKQLSTKVSYEVIEFKEFPKHYPAGVMVILNDGTKFTRWEKENRALSEVDLIRKFTLACQASLGSAISAEIVSNITSMSNSEGKSIKDTLAPLLRVNAYQL